MKTAPTRSARTSASYPSERGAVAFIVAICGVLLVGIGSLVVDLGTARQLDLKAQGASDAGALAAAQDLPTSGSNTPMTNTARATAAAFAASPYEQSPSKTGCGGGSPSGMKCYSVGAEVTIAVTSPYDSSDQKIHVKVCEDSQTVFAGVLGLVSPRACSEAVASVTLDVEAAPAVLALSETACDSLALHSSGDVVGAAGEVQVNSNCAARALSQEGSGATVISDVCVCVVGGSAMNNPSNAYPGVTTGAALKENPYRNVPVVPEPVATGYQASITVHPGTFENQLVLSGSSTYIFDPGIFYFKNGLKLEGTASIHGHQVMIYIAGGMLDFGGDPHEVHLSSLNPADDPTGQYEGIVLYQAPGNTTQAEYGDQTQGGVATGSGPTLGCSVSEANAGFEGGIYFPSATIKLRGTVTMCTTAPVVADRFNIEGSSLLHSNVSSFVSSILSDPVISLIN